MDEFVPTFTDVTKWDILHQYNTKGTRNKEIIVEPIGQKQYFFKGSKVTLQGEIRYKEEFWSEIVSSKVGQLLGFKMLDYNIAYNDYHEQKIGCISESMVDLNINELKEGVNYLTGFDSNYDPDSKHRKDQGKYTFEFICQALKHHDLTVYISDIVNLIIFDSIVGNSDRHQENWGIITVSIESIQIAKNISEGKSNMQLMRDIWSLFKNKDEKTLRHLRQPLHRFSPIYDSGCCLGREQNDEKVEKMIKDSQMLEAYIKRGQSEIHWGGEKKNHFDLVALLMSSYLKEVENTIQQVKAKHNEDKLRTLIDSIDENLPEEHIKYKLGDHRKELMFKLITLRLEKLFSLI